MLRNTDTRYGLIARLFHWSIAALFIGLIGLGWYMVGLTYYDPLYHDSLEWHKALGVVTLVLVAARLVWMVVPPRPRPVPTLTRFERIASKATHDLLLLALVVIPVSGYLISTAAGDPVYVFGWVSVPALVAVSDTWRDIAIAVHFYAAYGAAALALLHIAGALKHRLIDKDEVMGRML